MANLLESINNGLDRLLNKVDELEEDLHLSEIDSSLPTDEGSKNYYDDIRKTHSEAELSKYLSLLKSIEEAIPGMPNWSWPGKWARLQRTLKSDKLYLDINGFNNEEKELIRSLAKNLGLEIKMLSGGGKIGQNGDIKKPYSYTRVIII